MSALVLDRLWGCGDVDALFGTSLRTTTPWARGGKDRRGPTYDRPAVAALCVQTVGLIDVDPRTVRCSQPWLVREHVEYYLTGQWEISGRTSADQHLEANRFPIIVPDRTGNPVILAGHHRTAAALIEARPVRARVAAPGGAFHVTPRIVVDPTVSRPDGDTPEEHWSTTDPIVVASLDDAALTLARLGVTAADTRAAIGFASQRLPHCGGSCNG